MAYRPGLKSDYQNLVYRLGELNILKGILKKCKSGNAIVTKSNKLSQGDENVLLLSSY